MINFNEKGNLALKTLFFQIINWLEVHNTLAGLNIYWTLSTCYSCYFQVARVDIMLPRERSPGV